MCASKITEESSSKDNPLNPVEDIEQVQNDDWNVINQDVVNQLPVLDGNFGDVLENTILNGNEINAARVELQEQVI